jgi:hypothetical protein
VNALTLAKRTLCNAVYLAMLGFLAVLLIGPVIAILGVVVSLVVAVLSVLIGVFSAILPFIVIGFLIYLPFHVFDLQTTGWRKLGRVTRRVFDTLVTKPAEYSGRLVRRTAAVLPAVWHKTRGIGWAIGGIFLEMMAGAVVLGALTALMFQLNPHLRYEGQVGIAAAIGAMLGLMIGIRNHWPTAEEATVPTPTTRSYS